VLGVILLLQLTIAIGAPPTSAEYLPIRLAETAGYYAREGLSVDVRSTRAESGAAEALAQGQVDLAATSLEAMLRFGQRAGVPSPRVVFGLTAAPPVVLLGRGGGTPVKSVRDLAGEKIGLASPGGPEQTWLQAALARAKLDPAKVDLVSLGARGVATALEAGEIAAGFLNDPVATRLVTSGRAIMLLDFRSPRAVGHALGAPTVNAAVFVHGDRSAKDGELAAFARAVLAAERLIASEDAAALAAQMPQPVLTLGHDFEPWLETIRGIYLENGLVSPEAIRHTADIVRAHLPLPRTLNLSRPQDMLRLEPLRRALKSRPPA
jgi:ABC-type nitrate/sulfonate/bicarbonate transport system substrate-binding protein